MVRVSPAIHLPHVIPKPAGMVRFEQVRQFMNHYLPDQLPREKEKLAVEADAAAAGAATPPGALVLDRDVDRLWPTLHSDAHKPRRQAFRGAARYGKSFRELRSQA